MECPAPIARDICVISRGLPGRAFPRHLAKEPTFNPSTGHRLRYQNSTSRPAALSYRAPGPVGHYVPIDDDELKP